MTINVPPAASVLAVCGVVYGIVQALKKVPGLGQYITGWVSVVVNVVFSVSGTLIANAITPANLYTLSTLQLVATAVVTALGAAGIHGSVKLLFQKPPTTPNVSPSVGPVVPKVVQPSPEKTMRSALHYLKTSGVALLASLVIMLPVSVVTGCSVSIAQIQTDANAVATALQSVATIEQTADAALSQKLAEAATALKQAAASLTSGGTIAAVNDALNVAAIALSFIPATAAIAPLIPIAEAAIDILLADVAQQAGGTPTPPTPVPSSATYPRYQYTPAHIHHRIGRSPEGDFKAAWNGVVKQHSELAAAAIQ